MAFTGPVEDQIAIRALNETYADAVFRRDAESWGATWAEDARWDLLGNVVSGRQAIVQMWLGAMANYPFAAFFVQLGSLAVDGDRATGVVYTQEVLEQLDGTTLRTVGRYADEYVRRQGSWFFLSRMFSILKG